MIAQHSLDRASRYNRKSGVAFALHGLVDGTDAGSGSDVEGGAGEEVENLGGHGFDVGWWLMKKLPNGFDVGVGGNDAVGGEDGEVVF